LDFSGLYARYGARGGEPYAPEVLLRVLVYGYATGVFSSRKLEQATYERVTFRYLREVDVQQHAVSNDIGGKPRPQLGRCCCRHG